MIVSSMMKDLYVQRTFRVCSGNKSFRAHVLVDTLVSLTVVSLHCTIWLPFLFAFPVLVEVLSIKTRGTSATLTKLIVWSPKLSFLSGPVKDVNVISIASVFSTFTLSLFLHTTDTDHLQLD